MLPAKWPSIDCLICTIEIVLLAMEAMAKQDIDGGLIGGAALKADSFTALIQNALNA